MKGTEYVGMSLMALHVLAVLPAGEVAISTLAPGLEEAGIGGIAGRGVDIVDAVLEVGVPLTLCGTGGCEDSIVHGLKESMLAERNCVGPERNDQHFFHPCLLHGPLWWTAEELELQLAATVVQ